MAKKLILLLLLIPIIVMICLFAATKTISNLVDVPVTGIEIIDATVLDNQGQIYLNLDDPNDSYTLEYVVHPTGAKNKKINVSSEAVPGKDFAELEFEQSDSKVKIKPKSAGSAKVYLATVEGGFKASVMVHVESTALKSISSEVTTSKLAVGDRAFITTTFLPSNPSNTLLHYESSNENVAKVSPSGVITALSKGTAEITVTSDYNANISTKVTVEVYNKDAMDLGATSVSSGANGKISISIDADDFDIERLSYDFFDKDGNKLSDSFIAAQLVQKSEGAYELKYEFKDEDFVGKVTVKITYTNGEQVITKECEVEKLEGVSVFFNNTETGIYAGQTGQILFEVTPEDEEVEYELSVDNNNVSVKMIGNTLAVTANKAGISKVTLCVIGATSESTASTTVVVKPKNLSVAENSNTYGIEDLLTVGNFEYDYTNNKLVNTAETKNKVTLHYTTSTVAGEGFYDNLKWVSDTADVYIDKNGVISFANDTFVGIVKFHAEFTYGSISEKTETFSARCVANAVNVYTYKDLWTATTAEKPIVLRNNIKDDFGYIDGVKNVKYTEIHTTYDDTYYKNTNSLDAAKVKILISFKNDVYGNGYAINAHNVAYGLDDSDQLKSDALFKGPLDFVAMHETKASITVKGQDNICFALYEDVTVKNVELRGCDLKSDKDGNIDLIDLTYTGTTVEILGDNTSIEYSRLTNGRTVVRAFGDISDASKVINLNIQNTVLSGAREFIMRVGSNCFVEGTYENPYPSIDGDSTKAYDKKDEYAHLSDTNKQSYDSKYIKTFINVKNSVFKDAGLFAIGVDSHFAGKALEDGNRLVYKELGSIGNLFKTGDKTSTSLIDTWKNLAKTSYGAKVTFEGQVELLTWKNLDNVDSSTLVDVPEGSIFYGKIDFDVKDIVDKLPNSGTSKGITYTEGNKKYVHAGIVFFGGGKNYGVFDSKMNSQYTLSTYRISLQDIGKDYFRFAAGEEDFFFFMYNADSAKSGFGYKDQQVLLGEGGKGYDCIYNK